jgi:septation ring formation regulator EzrA
MPQDPTPSGPDVQRLMVPEELLRQLHDAGARLEVAKQHLEEAMDETELVSRHGQQVEDRLGELRKTEKELEEISEKIKEILGRTV